MAKRNPRWEITAAARMLAPKALSEVAKILASPSAKPFEKLGAASLVFDRAYGKAPQSVQLAISQAPVELSSLTNDELAILAGGGSLPRLVQLPTGEVLDGQSSDVTPQSEARSSTASIAAFRERRRLNGKGSGQNSTTDVTS